MGMHSTGQCTPSHVTRGTQRARRGRCVRARRPTLRIVACVRIHGRGHGRAEGEGGGGRVCVCVGGGGGCDGSRCAPDDPPLPHQRLTTCGPCARSLPRARTRRRARAKASLRCTCAPSTAARARSRGCWAGTSQQPRRTGGCAPRTMCGARGVGAARPRGATTRRMWTDSHPGVASTATAAAAARCTLASAATGSYAWMRRPRWHAWTCAPRGSCSAKSCAGTSPWGSPRCSAPPRWTPRRGGRSCRG